LGIDADNQSGYSLMGYLASDAASFVTGQCIVIDGGLTITSPMTRMGQEP
jgi:NAD(P)-dependent dehydrogenase (short-subunit alcohol dehydrogenase family)